MKTAGGVAIRTLGFLGAAALCGYEIIRFSGFGGLESHETSHAAVDIFMFLSSVIMMISETHDQFIVKRIYLKLSQYAMLVTLPLARGIHQIGVGSILLASRDNISMAIGCYVLLLGCVSLLIRLGLHIQYQSLLNDAGIYINEATHSNPDKEEFVMRRNGKEYKLFTHEVDMKDPFNLVLDLKCLQKPNEDSAATELVTFDEQGRPLNETLKLLHHIPNCSANMYSNSFHDHRSHRKSRVKDVDRGRMDERATIHSPQPQQSMYGNYSYPCACGVVGYPKSCGSCARDEESGHGTRGGILERVTTTVERAYI